MKQTKDGDIALAARVAVFLEDRRGVLATMQLAELLARDGEEHGSLAQRLVRLAPRLPVHLATHDGRVYKFFGRTVTAWRWHGQFSGE